jgi:hypothetical protein
MLANAREPPHLRVVSRIGTKWFMVRLRKDQGEILVANAVPIYLGETAGVPGAFSLKVALSCQAVCQKSREFQLEKSSATEGFQCECRVDRLQNIVSTSCPSSGSSLCAAIALCGAILML